MLDRPIEQAMNMQVRLSVMMRERMPDGAAEKEIVEARKLLEKEVSFKLSRPPVYVVLLGLRSTPRNGTR